MFIFFEQVQMQKYKAMDKRHPKQHVSKQSCSNIQLSSKYGAAKKKKKKKKTFLQQKMASGCLFFCSQLTSISDGVFLDTTPEDEHSAYFIVHTAY